MHWNAGVVVFDKAPAERRRVFLTDFSFSCCASKEQSIIFKEVFFSSVIPCSLRGGNSILGHYLIRTAPFLYVRGLGIVLENGANTISGLCIGTWSLSVWFYLGFFFLEVNTGDSAPSMVKRGSDTFLQGVFQSRSCSSRAGYLLFSSWSLPSSSSNCGVNPIQGGKSLECTSCGLNCALEPTRLLWRHKRYKSICEWIKNKQDHYGDTALH